MKINKTDEQKLKYLVLATKMFLSHAIKFEEDGYEPPNHWIRYARENIEEIECIFKKRKKFRWFNLG